MKLRMLGALAAAMVASACGTEEAPDPLAPSGPIGRVRFVNLITDPTRNPVNAILEGVPFGVGLTYTAATPATLPAPSTALYSAVLAGNRSLVLKRTADTTVTVATLPLSITADTDITVFATGGTGGGTVTAFTTTDDNSAPTAGQARVRVINMSPRAGAIDVFVTAANADLAAATPTVANLAVRGPATYSNIAPGTYQVRAVPAGTAPAARAANVIATLTTTPNTVVIAAGNVRTIVAADNAAATGALAFVLSDR
jgi:hypothetical protein